MRLSATSKPLGTWTARMKRERGGVSGLFATSVNSISARSAARGAGR